MDALGSAGYKAADEKSVCEDFRAEGVRFVQAHGLNDLDWLAIAQHHGVPTRLLDWSTNPLVAAWFAVQEQHREESEIHAIWVGWKRRMRRVDLWKPDLPVTIVQVPAAAARITAQQGCFSLHENPDVVWDPFASGYRHDRFRLAGTDRDFIRSRLKVFGVDSSRLMADLDGIGAELAWSYARRP